ncbi:MAG: CHAD domain-containing protein [Polyangiaceae bacterium]|nr:CHAD domain-containing protein [Polyangiaceae bacterium]
MSAQPIVVPAPIDPPRAGPFLGAALRALSSRIAEAAPRVLAGGDDEAVHDLRVAIRRARIVLRVGRPVFGSFRADETRRVLRDVQAATGALRDEEVLLELIESLGVDRADVRVWIDARRRRERRLRSALRSGIQRGEVGHGRALIDALLAFPVKPSRERPLEKFALRSVETAWAALGPLRRAPIGDAEALHALRIGCKRLRYTVETFDGCLPPEKVALARVASRLQSCLGDLHDIDVAVASIGRARALTDLARRALAVELQRARGENAGKYLAALAEALPALP